MNNWKNADYGIPKTWAEQQQEKRQEELKKISASPLPMLMLAGALFAAVVCGAAFILWSVLR